MSEVQKESRKRSKKYYMGGSRAKQIRRTRELEAGMQGILITCNNNHLQCISEAYSLLNEYGDTLYGPEEEGESEQKNDEENEDDVGEELYGDDFYDTDDDDDEEEDEDDDVEAALEKEVKQMKASSKKPYRRFSALESGANNVVFIRTLGVEPDHLVHTILDDLHNTGKLKSRAVLRMLPVCGSCKAFPDDMMSFFYHFLQPWFRAPSHSTYMISIKTRNCHPSLRDTVIKNVAGLVNRMNPMNRVVLSNPELTIIIEIIKSICCASVVRDYIRFRKYNLQELAKDSRPSRGSQRDGGKKAANQERPPKEGENKAANQEEAEKVKEVEPSEGGAVEEGAVTQESGAEERKVE